MVNFTWFLISTHVLLCIFDFVILSDYYYSRGDCNSRIIEPSLYMMLGTNAIHTTYLFFSLFIKYVDTHQIFYTYLIPGTFWSISTILELRQMALLQQFQMNPECLTMGQELQLFTVISLIFRLIQALVLVIIVCQKMSHIAEDQTTLPDLFVITASNSPCSICLEDITEKNMGWKLSCHHSFHQPCIETWLEHNEEKTCPNCRNSLTV